jgi:TalC/MipB family fructose-6-phosphate aldolase
VVVKIPLTRDGLIACAAFADEEIKTNVTLCFSPTQALLAAKAGATYISPFIGRLDDYGFDGMDLIRDIRAIYDNFGYETEILAASVRNAAHVKEAAIIGADVVTIPPSGVRRPLQAPADRQGPRAVPEGLGRHGPIDPLGRLSVRISASGRPVKAAQTL